MDPRHGFHRRFLNKRQGLDGVLKSLLSGGSTSSSVTQEPTTSQSTGGPLGLGGVVGGITSLFGDVSTTSSAPSSSATLGISLTHSSSSSTGSTTIPASSTKTTSSISPTTSTSTTLTTPAPSPTPTPSVSDTVYVSSDGTRVVYITSTAPAASPTASHPPSFLQNPSLEGGIFALVGIVVLIIIIIVVTWTIRKRRRDSLERDLAAVVTFDPGATDHYERQEDLIEKHRLSGSSSGHGRGYGYGMQPAYASREEYRGPVDYGQYPAAAYSAYPNSLPYQVPSPAGQQEQGGANLTRKFSDRKPVPPLLPNPAYDPTNSHVSIPPQFYHK